LYRIVPIAVFSFFMNTPKNILVLLLLQLSLYFNAQNLVPNGDFENSNSGCPTPELYINQTVVESWYVPTNSSPDLFKINCPTNLGGVKDVQPHSGIYHVGCILYQFNTGILDTAGIFTREYLAVKLTEELVQGEQYCIEMYIMLAMKSKKLIDKFGVGFSSDSIYEYRTDASHYWTEVPRRINLLDGYFADSLNWVKVSKTFIANGGERFMIIGNLWKNGECILINNPVVENRVSDFIYYYIDDISLTLCNDPTESTWNLYPNPSNDGTIQLNGHLLTEGILSVHNEIGQLVYSEKIAAGDFNKNYPLQLASGVYCVTINEAERSITKKVVILK
jgi:OOP family OmpA-OmpF porin